MRGVRAPIAQHHVGTQKKPSTVQVRSSWVPEPVRTGRGGWSAATLSPLAPASFLLHLPLSLPSLNSSYCGALKTGQETWRTTLPQLLLLMSV